MERASAWHVKTALGHLIHVILTLHPNPEPTDPPPPPPPAWLRYLYYSASGTSSEKPSQTFALVSWLPVMSPNAVVFIGYHSLENRDLAVFIFIYKFKKKITMLVGGEVLVLKVVTAPFAPQEV